MSSLTDLFTNWSEYPETSIPLPPQFLAQYLVSPLFHFLILDPWLLFQGATGYTITSAYRDPEHNAEVGGVPDSAHQFGVAADVVFDAPTDLAALAASWEDEFGGYTQIYSDGHIHVNLSRAWSWSIIRISGAIVLAILVGGAFLAGHGRKKVAAA